MEFRKEGMPIINRAQDPDLNHFLQENLTDSH